MSSTVIYEVARYSGPGDGATLLESVQLIAVEGVLRVRDSGGSETVCVGADVGVEIGSTPALREVRAGQEARITCRAGTQIGQHGSPIRSLFGPEVDPLALETATPLFGRSPTRTWPRLKFLW